MVRLPLYSSQIVTLLAAVGVGASVTGCGRTLVFSESDGVNLAVRTNSSSSTPVEVNFGLTRTIATIVPPAGQTSGKPSGEAVNMFAGFQVDNTLEVKKKAIDVDLTIDTQFASGQAALAVAGKRKIVAQIVNPTKLTYSSSDSTAQLKAWLLPPGTGGSKMRATALQAWLKMRYPNKFVLPADFLDDDEEGEFEAGRRVALKDTALMKTPAN